MKKIGIYTSQFQPPTRSHYDAYKKLKNLTGDGDVYVLTTDRDPTPNAPLNFGDKEHILVRHGIAENNIIKTSILPSDNNIQTDDWRPNEVFKKYPDKFTIALFLVNSKDISLFYRRKGKTNTSVEKHSTEKIKTELEEIVSELSIDNDEKGEMWLNPQNEPQYFQPYKGNEQNLKSFDQHGYVIFFDDTKIDGKPVSTNTIEQYFGSDKYDEKRKQLFFRWLFGWFDIGLYKLISSKFKNAYKVSVMSETINTLKFRSMVREILSEILMGEDYNNSSSQTSNVNNSNDNGENQQKSDAQIRSEKNKNKIDLVKRKKEKERDLKSMENDLKWKQTSIQQIRKDKLPNTRQEINNLNKQMSGTAPLA